MVGGADVPTVETTVRTSVGGGSRVGRMLAMGYSHNISAQWLIVELMPKNVPQRVCKAM